MNKELSDDEVYTRVGKILLPASSGGWTISFLECDSRYWVATQAGIKDSQLFEQEVQQAWDWAKSGEWGR